MSIQSIPVISSNSNSNSFKMTTNRPATTTENSNFGHTDLQKASNKVKIGSLLGTLIGISSVMALTLHGKNKNINNAAKKMNIFNIVYDKEKYEIEKLVTSLTLASVGGGLIGGAITDKKENLNAKIREAVIQTIGNSFTPLVCVAGGTRLFEKYLEPQLLENMKFLKGNMKGLPKAVVSMGLLLGSIFLGNKVGNAINEKLFKVDDKREIKLSDMSPNIDDMCTATTFVLTEGKLARVVSRLIPLALMIAGYSTGSTQEKPEILEKRAKSQ